MSGIRSVHLSPFGPSTLRPSRSRRDGLKHTLQRVDNTAMEDASAVSAFPVTDAREKPAAAPRNDGAISPEQLQAITVARHQGRRISRAAMVASISGWTMAFFGAISLLVGLFSVPSFLLGLGLSVVAFVELRGARGLRALDLAAPRSLALNQLGLLLVVIAYAGWCIVNALVGPGAYDEQLAAGGPLAKTLAPIDHLTRAITVAFYAAVIGGSLVAQACASAYYFSRRNHMLAYLKSTPKWVIETLRATSR